MPGWPQIGWVPEERTPVFPEGDRQYFNCAWGTVRVPGVNCNLQVREFEAAFVVLADAVKASLVKPHWKLPVESVHCHSATTMIPGWREAESLIADSALNGNNCLEGCLLSGGVEENKGEWVKTSVEAGNVPDVQNRQAQHLVMLHGSQQCASVWQIVNFWICITNLGVRSVALFDDLVRDSRLNSGHIKMIDHFERREDVARGVSKDRVESLLIVGDEGAGEKELSKFWLFREVSGRELVWESVGEEVRSPVSVFRVTSGMNCAESPV